MTGALFDLGGLTKPATVLVERVSDAVGGIARPWQIERVARAEARADVERAKAKIEISDLERRALERLVREEGSRQRNIESITYGSLPYLNERAAPEEISQDWLSHFFERSRLTSDDQMQVLWSKILAGEANAAGTISRRTVDLVSTLEKEDAELLSRAFTWTVSLDEYKDQILIGKFTDYQFVVDYGNASFPFSFNDLCHLEDIGFIKFEGEAGYSLINLPETVEFKDGKFVGFVKPSRSGKNRDCELQIGNAILTKAGRELASIAKPKEGAQLSDAILCFWYDKGYPVGHLISNQ